MPYVACMAFLDSHCFVSLQKCSCNLPLLPTLPSCVQCCRYLDAYARLEEEATQVDHSRASAIAALERMESLSPSPSECCPRPSLASNRAGLYPVDASRTWTCSPGGGDAVAGGRSPGASPNMRQWWTESRGVAGDGSRLARSLPRLHGASSQGMRGSVTNPLAAALAVAGAAIDSDSEKPVAKIEMLRELEQALGLNQSQVDNKKP